jgi:hypothetical protein
MGLPQEGHGGYSGADASDHLDPDVAIADEMLDDHQGNLDLHGSAIANKHQRYAHGGQ